MLRFSMKPTCDIYFFDIFAKIAFSDFVAAWGKVFNKHMGVLF